LNVTLHYRHADNTSANAFPALGGSSSASAWDIPVNYSFTMKGLTHSARFGFNRQHAETQNLFGGVLDVAGAAGLAGVSTDPFDWGAPSLSFSTIAGVRDTNPSMRTDRTLSVGDTIVKIRGAHTLRFGGDYRSIHADSRADANARGSFVFTGLYTGVDFADFLLGLPQQASVQYGPLLDRFRSRSADCFVQDDWRASDKVTVNAGLRYEYFSPVSEADDRLATLDAAPGFTDAVRVIAGANGPFSGALPDTIVRPFRSGFAPRVGIAWRPKAGTVVRTGYGVNYNASAYQTIAQQLAGQPPFASPTPCSARVPRLRSRRCCSLPSRQRRRIRTASTRITGSVPCRSGISTCNAISRGPSRLASATPEAKDRTSTFSARPTADRAVCRFPASLRSSGNRRKAIRSCTP
jgi:outer membrane receptor protein involved in Fe transport